ncbi:MAG TPA: hypothetical protein DF699_15655 [Phycisphaerales bacterium]|nr:hypothetical protein [Phycisphaerae bacterium]HCT46641.1 hypothetical protein [Phycisphaerales bacterium]
MQSPSVIDKAINLALIGSDPVRNSLLCLGIVHTLSAIRGSVGVKMAISSPICVHLVRTLVPIWSL